MNVEIAASSSIAGRLSVPGICSGRDRARGLRGSSGAQGDVAPEPKKTACGVCGRWPRSFDDQKFCLLRDLACGEHRIYLELRVRRVACRRCGKVKRERLTGLADNPFYTKRFAWLVGRRCRTATIKDVARELGWHGDTVKELEKQDLREPLRRAGKPAPTVIGLDEISIRRGHPYRMGVSALLRRRPLWFGGQDRSQESMELFTQQLGLKQTRGIYLAVLDRWKPFKNATLKHAPAAAILFDKFQVVSHLGEALDQVRPREEARLTGKNRQFIKGQKDTLLSNRANLTLEGRRSLAKLRRANQRLNTASLLKESFGQLWDLNPA